MNHVDCPHCGVRNLRLFASTGLRRCRACGRTLATDELEVITERAAAAHRRLGRGRDVGARGPRPGA